MFQVFRLYSFLLFWLSFDFFGHCYQTITFQENQILSIKTIYTQLKNVLDIFIIIWNRKHPSEILERIIILIYHYFHLTFKKCVCVYVCIKQFCCWMYNKKLQNNTTAIHFTINPSMSQFLCCFLLLLFLFFSGLCMMN